MNGENDALVQRLRENDPVAEVSSERLTRLTDRILAQALKTPQDAPAPRRLWTQGSACNLLPRLGLAVMLVALGLAAGQSLQDARGVGQTAYATQQSDVIALASPWKDWVEEH